ncbi:MAG: hypothetical protein PHD56_11295 [Anaerostipes sp.]|nr:hypothetical protein [Anaerostipes sp.]
MNRNQIIQLAEKEYYREFLRRDCVPNERKLEILRNFLEEVKPVPNLESLEQDIFYKELVAQIHKIEKHHMPIVIGKVASIVLILMLCSNGISEAATNKSIFYYINEIKDKVTEFSIGINGTSKSTENTTTASEGDAIMYEEIQVSSWKEVNKLCKWNYVYPRKVTLKQKSITVTTEEGKGNSILAQYEKGSQFATVDISHFEDDQGVIDYSFGNENKAKIRKRLEIANIKFIIYKTSEEVICVGTDERNVYEIHSTQSYQEVMQMLKSMK